MKKKSERLYDAITELPDSTVAVGAEPLPATMRHRGRFIKWASAAAACLVFAGALGSSLLVGNRRAPHGEPIAGSGTASHIYTVESSDSSEGATAAPTQIPKPDSPGLNAPGSNAPSEGMPSDGSPVRRLSFAEYPEYIAVPDWSDYGFDKETEYISAMREWRQAYNERHGRFSGMPDGFESFLKDSIKTFAGDSESKNVVVSPLSLYIALGMLAETADGATRDQIFDTVGAESVEELRQICSDLWNSLYRDDKTTSVILGNSIWMSDEEKYIYNGSVTDALAEHYFASAFTGDVLSEEYLNMYKDWLNENTGGLLKEAVAEENFPEDLVMRLVNTVYFKAGWGYFSEADTEKGAFYADGGEVTADFMHTRLQGYYYGDNFAAVKLGFSDDAYSMWFILPDEGHTVDEVTSDPQALELIFHGATKENYRKDIYVNLSLPKFDISVETDLTVGLLDMGITDAFNPIVSDFRILDNEGVILYISRASQNTRLKIDEEGCEGAAYTVFDNVAIGDPPPPELDEIDLVFDRPFAVAVVNEHSFDGKTNNLPLFVGVVNDPTEK